MDELEENLIYSLTTIRDYCRGRMGTKSCSECLLGSNSKGCKVTEKTPNNWLVNEPEPIKRLMR